MKTPMVFRVLGYAIMGAMALVMGSQLLSSVAWAVLAWRQGNILPTIVIAATTLMLMFLTGRYDADTPQYALLNALAWSVAVYLIIVTVLILLPYGVIPAIIVAALFVPAITAAKNPVLLREKLTATTRVRMRHLPNTGKPVRNKEVYLISKSEAKSLIASMRNSHESQVSITKYLSHFAIVVNESASEAKLLQKLEAGIRRNLSKAGPLLKDTVLRLPLIEEEYGLAPEGYHLVDDSAAVEKVLTEWPLRATLFSTRYGLVLTARKEDVSGFLTREIPEEHRSDILVKRDIESLNAVLEGGG